MKRILLQPVHAGWWTVTSRSNSSDMSEWLRVINCDCKKNDTQNCKYQENVILCV